MHETHVFNENLKRFEPIDSKCMFCDSGHSQNVNENCFIPIFNEQERSGSTTGYRTVKYNKISIGISRCCQCFAIHKSAELKGKLAAWGIGIAVCTFLAIPLILKFANNSFWGIFFSILMGAIIGLKVGFYLFHFFENKFVKQKGILTKQGAASKYKVVQDLLNDGWTFKEPEA